MCSVNTLVKSLTTTSVYHYIFLRFLVGLLIVSIWIAFKDITLFRTKHFACHFYRNSLAFVGIVCHFIAIHKLNLLDVFLIDRLATLLIPIGLYICFSINVSWDKWIAIIIGFFATIYAINPSFDLIHFETLIALGYPLSVVSFIIILRLIKNDDHLTILFYCFFFNTVFSSLFIFFGKSTSIEFIPIIAMGLLTVLTQLFLTKAYFYANPVHVNCMSYLDIFIGAVLGWLIWQEAISLRKVIASIIIFCVGGYILLKKEKKLAVQSELPH